MNISYYIKKSNLDENEIVINIGTHEKAVSLHNHSHTELTIVLGGSAIHEIEGHPFSISQGDVYVVPPESNHRYTDVHDLTLCDILISVPTFLKYNSIFDLLPSFHELFLQFGTSPEFNRFHIEDESDFQFVRELCYRVLNEYHQKPPGYKIVSSHYFAALLSCLLRSFPTSTKINDFRLHTAIEYISIHYIEKISIRDLSRLSSLSERQFYRLFKSIYGLSPVQYIKQLRISHAAQLLITTDLSLSRIAIQSGFPDQSLFSKQFSEYYHMSPREFRQSSRKPIQS